MQYQLSFDFPVDPVGLPGPVVGPAICQECHLPTMFWFASLGWLESRITGYVLGVPVHTFHWHNCTGRDLPEVFTMARLMAPHDR